MVYKADGLTMWIGGVGRIVEIYKGTMNWEEKNSCSNRGISLLEIWPIRKDSFLIINVKIKVDEEPKAYKTMKSLCIVRSVIWIVKS